MIRRIHNPILLIATALLSGHSAPASGASPQCGAFAAGLGATLLMNLANRASAGLAGQFGDEDRTEVRPEGIDPLAWHVSDPEAAIPFVQKAIEEATRDTDREFGQALLERLKAIERPKTVRLSLQDAIHRALFHSHAIRVESYRPAIGTTTLVEAEAAFDAVYFMNLSNNSLDIPTGSTLVGSQRDSFDLSGGFRKRLTTGALLTTSLAINRDFSSNQFQFINPTYGSTFTGELTQPLLRNGGIDFNRSSIEIAKNDRKISESVFKRQVRQILFDVERAYWQLVKSRREVTIQARLLTQFEKIYDYLFNRRDFDTYAIQLNQTEAELQRSKAEFIAVISTVRDAEDALIAALNDPSMNLADEIELIPTDFPNPTPRTIDRLGAVQSALDHRAEIQELRLQIDNAKLRVDIAKNQALPRLDVTFRYTTSGLGTNFDQAFDQSTQSDFLSYLVVLDLELPVGNRARKAALHRASLLHAQTIASLESEIEQVILEVNLAARGIQTRYELIDPILQAANANEDQVASVIARQERKDFSALNQELSARRALANSRSTLLSTLVDYNTALTELERSKGTLFQYDNITLVNDHD